MATSSVKVFLVALVILASVSETYATCNALAASFRLLGCAIQPRFGCGILDAKLRLLRCRQFACEGYRQLKTFCTFRCPGLEISNGICRFGTRCCLTDTTFSGGFSSSGSSSSFGSFGSFEVNSLELNAVGSEETQPVAN